ncbi:MULTISPECIES: hypothetical protein [Actinosynnema]|uniref:hypothetical protein n=1 Tax=Actinosynnema TaxID=40566 RepID=UPI0020A40B7B|nr:hypothetical protein [Actinosynnema pretiosum]MCP2092756.1 hypothetical protein [Actinosynnema pretiosum]
MPTPQEPLPSDPPAALITGANLKHPLDALFVNAPLRDYAERPRVNDFTLPVLGMGYLATYAASQGFNVGVLDAEAHGLGINHTIDIVNQAAPRWSATTASRPASWRRSRPCSAGTCSSPTGRAPSR